ncbi:MAG: APC family permease [Desulfurococcales archaeon]|nr:APC family permease [Desulfurococcales archaeon]
MGEEVVFVRRASGLVRTIGPLTILSIAGSYVIADGFYYFVAGLGYQAPGSNIPLALVVGAVMMGFMAFAVVLLTVTVPRTASDYVAISRVLHPFLGYLEAILTIGVHIWIVGALSFFLAWFWGAFLVQAGILLGSNSLIAWGELLSTDVNLQVLIGIVSVIVFSVLQILGTNVFKYVVNVFFLVAIAAGVSNVAAAVYASTLSQAEVKALWDATFGAGAYDEIMSVARQTGWESYVQESSGIPGAWGWPGPWSLGVTLFTGLLASVYAFWGFEFANYMAGEVVNPRRSFLVGVTGAILLIVGYYLVVSTFTLLGFREFYSAYNYVMNTPEAVEMLEINPAQTPTWAVFLAGLLGDSLPLLAVLITLAVPLLVMDGLPVYIMVPTRIVFALSFDRMFPEKLAEVNDRFRSPHWSILLVMILGVIMVLLTAYSPWVYLISVITAISVRWLFSAIALMLLPFRRPDLYAQGVTRKVAGIPVVTIVGAIATAFSLAVIGLGTSQIIGDPVSTAWMVLWIALAVVLYLYYSNKNKKRGIDISRIYKEVPPL